MYIYIFNINTNFRHNLYLTERFIVRNLGLWAPYEGLTSKVGSRGKINTFLINILYIGPEDSSGGHRSKVRGYMKHFTFNL